MSSGAFILHISQYKYIINKSKLFAQSFIYFDNKNNIYNIYYYNNDKTQSYSCKYNDIDDINTIIYLINILYKNIEDSTIVYDLYELNYVYFDSIINNKAINCIDILNFVNNAIENTKCFIIESKKTCKPDENIIKMYFNIMRTLRVINREDNPKTVKFNTKKDMDYKESLSSFL